MYIYAYIYIYMYIYLYVNTGNKSNYHEPLSKKWIEKRS